MSLLSKEVHTLQSLNIDQAAEQKLAAYLLSLLPRVNLLMPRRGIANHLNVLPKTVSRLLNRLLEIGGNFTCCMRS